MCECVCVCVCERERERERERARESFFKHVVKLRIESKHILLKSNYSELQLNWRLEHKCR